VRAIERHVRNLSSVMTKFIVVTGASRELVAHDSGILGPLV